MIRTLALAMLVGSPVLAQDAAEKSKIEAKLSLKIDIAFKDNTVGALADYLTELTGLNFFVDNAVREERMSLEVKNLSVRSILNLALQPRKLGFGYRDGVLRIAKLEEFQKEVKLDIIDVRDLLYPISDFPGVEITLTDTGIVTSGDPGSTPAELPLVDLIKAHTGGKTWEDNPKASLSLNNGLIVIKQTPEVIRQVRRVINELRRYK